MTLDAKKAKQQAYIKDLEGRCFAQGFMLVRIADLCRTRGGDLAAEILSLTGEILEPKEADIGRGKA